MLFAYIVADSGECCKAIIHS